MFPRFFHFPHFRPETEAVPGTCGAQRSRRHAGGGGCGGRAAEVTQGGVDGGTSVARRLGKLWHFGIFDGIFQRRLETRFPDLRFRNG